MDCTRSYGSFGCHGGWPNSSYEYIKDHGVAPDVKYPYLGFEAKCHNISTTRANVKIVSYRGVEEENEEALKEAVGKQYTKMRENT